MYVNYWSLVIVFHVYYNFYRLKHSPVWVNLEWPVAYLAFQFQGSFQNN